MDFLERAVISVSFLAILMWCSVNSFVINSQGRIIEQLKESQTVYISDDSTLAVVGNKMEQDADLHDQTYSALDKINKTLETLKQDCKPKG